MAPVVPSLNRELESDEESLTILCAVERIAVARQTLRRKDKQATARRREQIMRGLLARSDDIGEVILYEAADWTYNLSLDDPHRYLAPASPMQ
ncbi:MAG: hypothetical protein ABGZ17_15505 [Planctomycetaceae bacterium]